ncbi:hypothetical protein AGMMS49975_11520 [Clostridia bacterium]|nr:hypothetical protein AGMMS49975_11520 [Clostridia bacterium]
MAAFELKAPYGDDARSHGLPHGDPPEYDKRRLRDECIIAPKIYDSCRARDCLTPAEIGAARSCKDGGIISPPPDAAAVAIEKLKIPRIMIVEKVPNPFKKGYWDIDIKFVFEYTLVFREANGTVICKEGANSIYNKRVTLFGSIGSELALATDLWSGPDNFSTIDSEPFILVEAKAVELSSELRFCGHKKYDDFRHDGTEHHHRPNEVLVTLGLFSITKLYRIVDLSVQSHGFCIPKECEEIAPINPCDFFERLDFPMDMFAPPQKPEFIAGISENIKSGDSGKPCGCA